MRKCRSAGHRSRHAVLWRRLALAAAVFCLCWYLADCIEDAMCPPCGKLPSTNAAALWCSA